MAGANNAEAHTSPRNNTFLLRQHTGFSKKAPGMQPVAVALARQYNPRQLGVEEEAFFCFVLFR